MLKQIQRLPFAPVVALMFAGVAAILVLATPVWLLEHAVISLGLPDLLPAAAPPLGRKARILLIVLGAASSGMLAFLVALPFRDPKPRKASAVSVPPLRKAQDGATAFNRPSVFAAPVVDEPNLPSFLAQPLAELQTESLPVAGKDDDELLLDSLMIVEEAEDAGPALAEPSAAPVFLMDPPQMPDIFIQPETVLHLEPAPLPPPSDMLAEEAVSPEPLVAPRPRIVEHREPTIDELMERFQRGLETLKRAETSPLDDANLRQALSQLERFAVGGR